MSRNWCARPVATWVTALLLASCAHEACGAETEREARSAGASSEARVADAARGRQVFALAGGCSCHTLASGPVGAGGAEIATPFGKFYGSNITPDAETGIGAWSDAEVDAALRRGLRRGGEAESPVMPWYWY